MRLSAENKMKIKPYITVSILMICYISLVFFCCLHKFGGSDSIDLGKYFLGIRLDRYIHFTMFFPYPFVAWIFINYTKRQELLKRYTYSLIIISGLVFASAAEASQEVFTTFRDTDPFDLTANITGIFTATLIVYLLRKPIKALCDKIL